MEMSSQKLQEARLVDIYSNLGKLHTDARLAAQMIPVFSAVDAMIPQTILGTWYMSVFRWAIADAVIAEILKPGNYPYIVQYTQLIQMPHRVGLRGKQPACRRSSLRVSE